MEQDELIRFDWAAKRLLRDKANFGVLEGLIEVLLGFPVTILEILDSESNQLSASDKFNRVDIKARKQDNELIIVEVQNTYEIDYLERILYGVAKTLTEHLKLGDEYLALPKVYSVSILYFGLNRGADYLYRGQNSFLGVHAGDELQISVRQREAITQKPAQEVFPEYYLILPKEFKHLPGTPLEEWVYYLKTGKIDPHTQAPGLAEAREKLAYFKMDLGERNAYDQHRFDTWSMTNTVESLILQGKQEGRQEGREEGRQEGERQASLHIAARMKAAGSPTELIAQFTGLPAEEIENI